MADLENTPNTEDSTITKPEHTELEQRAQAQGWVPQEEWSGDPEQWRPAKEFLDRGELFKKIDTQSRDIKRLERTLVDLQTHNAKIADVEYKRAMMELKAQKKAALIDGDADAVLEIDDRIDLVREAQKTHANTPAPVVESSDLNPVFVAWTERNPWFNTNRAMRAFANDVGVDLAKRGMAPEAVLAEVEKEVRKEFAEKFQNPNRQKAGSVEGSTNKGTKSGDGFALTDVENRVMQRFIATIPNFNRDKYIADLKKIKGV